MKISKSETTHNIKYVMTDAIHFGKQKNVLIFTAYVITNFEHGYDGDTRHLTTTQN